MQKSIVIAALLGHISAYKLKQRFIPGMEEDDLDGLVMQLAEKDNERATTFDHAFDLPQVKAAPEPKPQPITQFSKKQAATSFVQSDPISGSLGYPEPPKLMTPEAILERDLNSRKPVKFSYEPDQFPTTEDSWKWAEKKLKKKLEIPEMPDDEKDKNQAKYNTDENQTLDEDITTTLGNAYISEGNYGYRNHIWSYNNGTKNVTGTVRNFKKEGVSGTSYEVSGGFGGYDGSYYYNTPKHLDWWNHLIKDQADGMIPTGITINDMKKDPRFANRRDYEAMAHEMIKEKEAKEAAAAGKDKVKNEDKGAIGELKGLEKQVDTTDKKEEDAKKQEGAKKKPAAKKADDKPEADANKPAAGGAAPFMPPELTRGAAKTQGVVQQESSTLDDPKFDQVISVVQKTQPVPATQKKVAAPAPVQE